MNIKGVIKNGCIRFLYGRVCNLFHGGRYCGRYNRKADKEVLNMIIIALILFPLMILAELLKISK
jgi:hypothetical protein